jgi:cytidyltransferase-like protein
MTGDLRTTSEQLALLRNVYKRSLSGTSVDPGGSETDDLAGGTIVDRSISEGLVEISETGVLNLTSAGRARLRVVMIGGAFEIIHPGHLHTIQEAKKLGNTLVAVVATDKTVLRNKGREPVTAQAWRVRLVGALREVDVAIPGGQGSIYDMLQLVKPDVVALGYDQTHDPSVIEKEAMRRGLKVSVVRLNSPLPDVKTSKIVASF